MQRPAPQSVGRMLSWDKFEIYPRTGAVRQKYTEHCPRRTEISQSVCPLETKMVVKRAKTSKFKEYSFTSATV